MAEYFHVARGKSDDDLPRNMTGFYGGSTEEMIMNEMRSGSNTGWELNQLNQAGRLPEVNFYQHGAGTSVPNPFK